MNQREIIGSYSEPFYFIDWITWCPISGELVVFTYCEEDETFPVYVLSSFNKVVDKIKNIDNPPIVSALWSPDGTTLGKFRFVKKR